MSALHMQHAEPYILAGCVVEGGQVIGAQADVIAGLEAIIAGRARLSDAALLESHGIQKEWLRKAPLDMLKDAGWGSDTDGNLIGGDYEIRRVARIVDTLFGA